MKLEIKIVLHRNVIIFRLLRPWRFSQTLVFRPRWSKLPEPEPGDWETPVGAEK